MNAKKVRDFLKRHRRPAAAVVSVVAAATLVAPVLLVWFAPGGFSSWISWTTRLTALYAFTFIFMNIVSGALAPYFYAIFKPKPEYLLHVITGSLGFALALAHGLIVITQRYYRGFGAAWILGPVTLILLAFTIWVALDRTVRLKKTWRVIHQVNYLIFGLVYVKALLIGTDFKTTTTAQTATLILYSAYVGIALLALLVRLLGYQVQAAKRRETRAAKMKAPVG